MEDLNRSVRKNRLTYQNLTGIETKLSGFLQTYSEAECFTSTAFKIRDRNSFTIAIVLFAGFGLGDRLTERSDRPPAKLTARY